MTLTACLRFPGLYSVSSTSVPRNHTTLMSSTCPCSLTPHAKHKLLGDAQLPSRSFTCSAVNLITPYSLPSSSSPILWHHFHLLGDTVTSGTPVCLAHGREFLVKHPFILPSFPASLPVLLILSPPGGSICCCCCSISSSWVGPSPHVFLGSPIPAAQRLPDNSVFLVSLDDWLWELAGGLGHWTKAIQVICC